MTVKYMGCFLLSLCLLWGCGNTAPSSPGPDKGKPRDNTPVVNLPGADASLTLGNDLVSIDASHTDDGYIMVRYLGDISKVKLQLTGEDGITYTYNLKKEMDYDTLPLSSGNGNYTLTVFENISDDKYSTAYSEVFPVALKNEFTPFLYPNQFVNYNEGTAAVQKGAELCADVYSGLEAVTNIYNFTVNTISYDHEKARTVPSGYLPDIDGTLSTKKGICFDYAALMTCMLRSQNIPTKLQIGYAEEQYHAWISTYLEETGWVDNIIQFDGQKWTMLDPTFASSAKGNPDIQDFIKDPSHYTVKYSR